MFVTEYDSFNIGSSTFGTGIDDIVGTYLIKLTFAVWNAVVVVVIAEAAAALIHPFALYGKWMLCILSYCSFWDHGPWIEIIEKSE